MAKKKLFCVLEQSSYKNFELSIYHKKIFNKDFCDYYRLNWKEKDDISDFFQPNITKSEGLSLVYEKCPKNYEYYMFIDDDILFKSGKKIKLNKKEYYDPSYIIKKNLLEYNPLISSFDSFHTNCKMVNKYNKSEYLKKNNVYCWHESDYDVVIFHKSIMKLLFPIIYHSSTKYFKFIYYLLHCLYPRKLIRFRNIFYRNTRHVFTNSYEYINKYPFILSGRIVLNKLHALLNKHDENNNFFYLMYDKIKARDNHLLISKKYIPSKKKIKLTSDKLKEIMNINHIDYLNRSAIYVYNNLNYKTKNRLLANEKDYIILYSLERSPDFYNKILEYSNKYNINKYIAKIYENNIIDIINSINTNFNIHLICNIKKEYLKNREWFCELLKNFNLTPDEIIKIENLNKNEEIKIYKHRNLILSILYYDDFNEENISKIISY